MKKIIVLLALAVSFSCNSQKKKEFSEEALKSKLITLDDKEVTLKSVIEKNIGKKVMIEVWAGWCSDCVKSMSQLREIQSSFPGVEYVFISLDRHNDKWKKAIELHDLKGQHYWVSDPEGMKGSFGKSIDLDWIPRFIIIDEKGKVLLYKATEKDYSLVTKELSR